MMQPHDHNILKTQKGFSVDSVESRASSSSFHFAWASASPVILLRRQSTLHPSFSVDQEELQFSDPSPAQANVALSDLGILKTHLAEELHPRIDGIIPSTDSNVQLFTQITALKHQPKLDMIKEAIMELKATIAAQQEETQELKKSYWWLQARYLALDFSALVNDFREASPSCSQVWLQFQQVSEYRRKHRLQGMAYKDYLYQHQVQIEHQYGLSFFKYCIIMADLSTRRNHTAYELTVPSFVLLDSEAETWIAGQADRRELFTRMMGVSTHKLRHELVANRFTVPVELELFCQKYPDPSFRTTFYNEPKRE